MTLFTHLFRVDSTNHAIVNTRRNHKGRGTALCGLDLATAKRRPPERTPLDCDGCLAEHTRIENEGLA